MTNRLDKPDYCYTSMCPLGLCKCGHPLAQHPNVGKCQAVEQVKTKVGKGKNAEIKITEVSCTCKKFQAKGVGFVLGTGDPVSAKIATATEAPGTEEVAYRLGSDKSRIDFDNEELSRRKLAYPDIPVSILEHGAPLIGKSGGLINNWSFKNVGIKRDEIFMDNTLRCLPPKSGKDGGHYPKGQERKDAERCCRYYDRWTGEGGFDADIAIVGIHPASILREVTPLPLNNKAVFEKARDFVTQGFRVVCALGGKAARMFVPWAENVTRNVGEYRWLK